MRTASPSNPSRAIRHAVACSCVSLAFSIVIISALIPKGASAQGNPRTSLLVTTEWLGEHLNDSQLVLLHVGGKDDYAAEHIPGARFIDLDDISVSDHENPGGLMLQVLAPDVLREKLANLGISDDSRVIVYYGKDWVTPATRVVFTLDYAGLGPRTSVLDGGMGLWKEQKRPVTNAATPARQGTLSALKTRPIVVNAEWVKDNVGKTGISVVDGRAAVFYDGVQTGRSMSGPQRSGHIAGAKSVPYTEITTPGLLFKSTADLASIFEKAGVKPGDTVVGYCHIGQQATGMLFAARLLGHKVLLYDGSFEDWSAHESYPVEKSSASK